MLTQLFSGALLIDVCCVCCVALEQMDRAVLIELSTALGGLVQTMYLEREKAKAEEHKKQQRKQRQQPTKELEEEEMSHRK